MTWQQIAEGATGVGFFSYSCIYANLKGEAFDRAWGDTVRVASEVKAMSPVLLSVEPAPKFLGEKPNDLSLRTWRYEGKDYLVACDLSGKPSVRTVRFGTEYGSVSCAPGAEAALAADGAVELKLPAHGVAIVRMAGR